MKKNSIILALCSSAVMCQGAEIAEPTVTTNEQYYCLEAEDFVCKDNGWQETIMAYFQGYPNYWSRNKLMAEADDKPAQAVQKIAVPKPGKYNMWVRFESCYGFNSVFGIRIRQNDKIVFDKKYGYKEDRKYFPFHGYTVQEPWDWHSTDPVMAAGAVALNAGTAEIIIYKDLNIQPAARRVLDFIYITDDLAVKPGNGPFYWFGEKTEGEAAIISRFRKPFFFKVVLGKDLTEPLRLSVGCQFFVLGYFSGPARVFDYTVKGSIEREGRFNFYGGNVAAGKACEPIAGPYESAWQRYDASTTDMLLITAVADKEVNGEVRLVVADGIPCEKNIIYDGRMPEKEKVWKIVCSTGNGFLEQGTLAGKKAMTEVDLYLQQAEIVKSYEAAGRRPEIFGAISGLYMTDTGPEGGILPLFVALGLNGQAYRSEPQLYAKDNAEKYGIRTAMGYITLQNMHMTQKCYEGDFTDYRKAISNAYNKLVEDKVGYLPQNIKLIEESGPPPLEKLRTWPKMQEMFRQFCRDNGVKAEEALTRQALLSMLSKENKDNSNLWDYVELCDASPSLAEAHPELFYYLMKFRSWLFVEACRQATLEIEKVFPKGSLANSGSVLPSVGTGPEYARGYGHFDLFRRRGVTSYSSEISWVRGSEPSFIGPQTLSYEGTLGRAFSKYYNGPMGSYLITAASRGFDAESVRLASFALISHGFEYLRYYEIHCNDSSAFCHPEVLKAIKEVNYAAGAIEKDLMGVKARVEDAETALGWSDTTDIWDLTIEQRDPGLLQNNIYPMERHQLYYLLRHCQIPVDVLGEEDLAAGYLKKYKLYFLAGDHLSRKAADALLEWVKAGGTVVSVAGGGIWDEFNRENPRMLEVFGLDKAPLEKVDIALRAKLELLHKKPIDTAHFDNGDIDYYGYRQSLKLATNSTARILARTDAGNPAAIENDYGKGRAVLLGFLPGFAYIKPAIPLLPFGRSLDVEHELSGYIPTAYPESIRKIFQGFIAGAGVASPVVCSHPLVEATLLKGNDGKYRICLVNYSKQVQDNLNVTINGVSFKEAVDAATGKKVSSAGKTITLPLDRFKVLRLE